MESLYITRPIPAPAQSICYHAFQFYIRDWLIVTGSLVLYRGLNLIEPFHRFVGKTTMDDLMFPLKSNTIPFQAVPVVAFALPFLVFACVFFVQKNLIDLHHATLGLLFAIMSTGILTDIIKLVVGRPGPNFFWRCFPDGNAVYSTVTKEALCTGDNTMIKEGYKSFPRSFAGMVYLSLYLAGKFRLYNGQGYVAKLVIALSPLTIALLVGLSRVSDYWHHWNDVFAGALIGSIVAALCYHHFFPSIIWTNCGQPYNYHVPVTTGETRYRVIPTSQGYDMIPTYYRVTY